ncbi:DUF3710 domain-containing protein [Trueperella sp. LYQ141]|uniref:DUF3710 domain-containing protein n=1 Tax=Trueperella sp. LYQ141 TaxID=3391058 RepID=UPI0039835993
MGWFSRKTNSGDDASRNGQAAQDLTQADLVRDQLAQSAEHDLGVRANGPFDESEVDGIGERLDAGSLWIPLIPEAQVQFTGDRRTGQLLGLVYAIDGSALQIQAFAAPRSRGLWDAVRGDIMTSIASQGGTSQVVEGEFGPELHARMPVPDSTSLAPHRFIGIDGPRWLLRATLYGKAGGDDEAAHELLEIVRQVVVARGQSPHPPRELLPLSVPQPAKRERS